MGCDEEVRDWVKVFVQEEFNFDRNTCEANNEKCGWRKGEKWIPFRFSPSVDLLYGRRGVAAGSCPHIIKLLKCMQ